MKDLSTENFKTLMKEIEDTNKWKDISTSGIRKISIIKMAILPKVIYIFNINPYQNSNGIFAEIEKQT